MCGWVDECACVCIGDLFRKVHSHLAFYTAMLLNIIQFSSSFRKHGCFAVIRENKRIFSEILES